MLFFIIGRNKLGHTSINYSIFGANLIIYARKATNLQKAEAARKQTAPAFNYLNYKLIPKVKALAGVAIVPKAVAAPVVKLTV